MYATYTTSALVCGSRPSYTSDKSFLLFTESAGMLWATARSVREEKSKQRYALQDFSFIRVSLVKGKSGWRIGSVESEYNAFSCAASREARGAVQSVVKLLRQFMHGEEPQPPIFSDVKHVLAALRQLESAECHRVSDIFSLRLLNKLGYVAAHESYKDYLEKADWETLSPLPAAAYKSIEQAKNVSHL